MYYNSLENILYPNTIENNISLALRHADDSLPRQCACPGDLNDTVNDLGLIYSNNPTNNLYRTEGIACLKYKLAALDNQSMLMPSANMFNISYQNQVADLTIKHSYNSLLYNSPLLNPYNFTTFKLPLIQNPYTKNIGFYSCYASGILPY